MLHLGQYHKYQPSKYPDILLPTPRKAEAETVWIQCAPESGRYVDNTLEFRIAPKSASAILCLVRNVRTRSTGLVTREMELECKYVGSGLDSHPQSWTIRQFDGQKAHVEYAVTVRKREAGATLPPARKELAGK